MKPTSIVFPMLYVGSQGGIRVIVEIANYLADHGFSVTILIPRGNIDTVYQLSDSVRIHEIGPLFKRKAWSYLFFLITSPFYLKNSLSIATFFVTYFPVKLASFFWGTPYLYLVQGIETVYKGMFGKILSKLCLSTYQDSHIVAANPYLTQSLQELGATPYLNLKIGPSPIFFEKEFASTEKIYDLVYFLRPEAWKQIDRFDKILQILEEQHRNLSILGITQSQGLLQNYQDKGITCVIPKNDDEIVSYYDQSKVLLLTSSYEGFGLPPLEAMSRKTPAVVFQCGGPSSYIQDEENSFLVDDCSEAVSQILQLLDDPELYQKVSNNAYRSAKAFQLAAQLPIIQSVISQKLS